MVVFEERGKPEFPEKNLSEQSREPTNSAHIWRRARESNPGHIGGKRALSPLRQPCSPNNKTVLFYASLAIFFLFMQCDYGKFILKQLDYLPSFSTSDSLLVENSGS